MSPSNAQGQEGQCLDCGGTDGHHFMTCSTNKVQGLGFGGNLSEVSPEMDTPVVTGDALGAGEVGPVTEAAVEVALNRLPPTADEVVGDQMLWLIAKACHEVNRAYCASIGDRSHLSWDESDPTLRASAHSGVVAHFEDPELTPEGSHQKWLDYKRAEGWTFGNAKDAEAKTHPCFLPYTQLHSQDRTKDAMFSALCKTMLGGNIE